MHDRLRVRIAALQRAGVRSLLNAAPLPHPALSAPPEFSTGPSHLIDSDMPGLTSVALAPTLLRPVLSPLALLQSHTLKHTFRNPHIAALGKTALDLRESESAVGRALGRAFSAMERVEDEQQFALEQAQEAESMAQEYDESAEGEDLEMKANGRSKVDGSVQDGMAIDDEAGEGMTSSALLGDPDPLAPTSAPGLDPAFARLNALFITPGGLSIPMPGSQSSDSLSSSQGQQAHAVLTPVQQRDVVRAALECLNELAGDSREYVERLDEVRSRLAAVKRRRAQVWEALRLWALQREEEEDERERQANERAPVAA